MIFNKRVARIVLLGFAAFTASPCTRAADWTLSGALGAHDPTIIHEGNLWWCFTTGAGVPVKYSADGLAWNQGVRLFEAEKSWWRTWAPAMGALDVWAPDIHFFAGRYWCYYSVSEFGRNNSAIGLTSCTSILAGDWRDDGFVIGSRSGVNAFNAIDPHLTIDVAGNPWLVFGSWFDGIQIISLDPATMKPNGTVQAIARRNGGIEGANIVYAKGYYHLFVSIDVCCQGVNSTYKIAHGRSVNITGPYEDKTGVPMLAAGGSLLEVGGPRWKGPGGQDVYRDGNAWIIARHAYDANAFGAPTLRISDLYWDADKWPTFSASAIPAVAITSHPASITQTSGSAASLAVVASGASLSYQWFKNGAAVSSATNATLNFAALQGTDAGDYTVQVTSGATTMTSRMARVVVAAPAAGRIANMSVRSLVRTTGDPLIVGFVMSGGGKDVLVRAIGPGLTQFGVAGVLADPALAIHGTVNGSDVVLASNNNWGDGGLASTLSTTFSQVQAFPLGNTASTDAALVTTVNGIRTAHAYSIVPAQGGVVLVEVYDTDARISPRLINVSARNFAGHDSQTLIAGFSIDGNVPKRVLIRGVGPTLADFGVPGILPDPLLALHTTINNQDVVLATNDDWTDEPNVAAVSAATFAFPMRDESGDASIIMTLPAGTYTAVVSGANNTTGEALVEVYEAP